MAHMLELNWGSNAVQPEALELGRGMFFFHTSPCIFHHLKQGQQKFYSSLYMDNGENKSAHQSLE